MLIYAFETCWKMYMNSAFFSYCFRLFVCDSTLESTWNSNILLNLTVKCSVLKMMCVVFIIRLHGHTKEFISTYLLRGKSFVMKWVWLTEVQENTLFNNCIRNVIYCLSFAGWCKIIPLYFHDMRENSLRCILTNAKKLHAQWN